MTADHIDRAAEVIAPVLLRDYGMQYDASHMTADDFMDLARDAARALAGAGLLASPEHDTEAERLRADIEALIEYPTWYRGMYGCPRDMVSTDRLLDLLNQVGGEG